MLLLTTAFVMLQIGDVDAVASPLQKPLSEKGQRYISFLEFNGETADCIGGRGGGNRMKIDKIIGLDDFHILFKMEDSSYFINEIPGAKGCTGAGQNAAISINRGARSPLDGICAGDRATAFRGTGVSSVRGRFCELGNFYRLQREKNDVNNVTK